MNFSKIKTDYLVFMDNVRIDHLVRSWNTSHSKDGGSASASVDMIFHLSKEMTDYEFRKHLTLKRRQVYEIKKAIKGRTNLFIFEKNIVSGKFVCVFNGNVSDLYFGSSISKRTVSLTISAVGGMAQLMEVDSVLAIPFEEQALSGGAIAFKLKSRAMDIGSAVSIQNIKTLTMSEMTVSEIVDKTKTMAEKTNMIYRDDYGVSKFNSVIDRVKIYNDIDPDLLKAGIIESGFVTDSMVIESVYVTLAKQMNRLMLEFFEMPSGEIVVKAPYWNAPILYNHIIPDIAIISESSVERPSSKISRIVMQGDVTNSQKSGTTSYNKRFTTPMVSYKESEDGKPSVARLSNSAYSSSAFDDTLWSDESGNPIWIGGKTGITAIDGLALAEDNTMQRYLAYHVPTESQISHFGWRARIISTGSNNSVSPPGIYTGRPSDMIFAEYLEGPYKGFVVAYGGIKTLNTTTTVGSMIRSGDVLGAMYYNPEESRSVFFVMVLFPDFMDIIGTESAEGKVPVSRIFAQPKAVFRDFSTGRSYPTYVDIEQVSIDDFRQPSDIERTYGLRVAEEMQPLIKYNLGVKDERVLNTLERFAAFRFKTINSSANTMSLTTIPMPWIKPGFNVWVDPAGINEVYYVASVSRTGGAQHQSSTSLQLVMGRPATAFFGKEENVAFGEMSTSGSFGAGVFISKATDTALFDKAAAVRSYVSAGGYDEIISASIKHKSYEDPSYDMSDDPYMKKLFGDRTNTSINPSPRKVPDIDFNKEFTDVEAQKVLTALFSNGPDRVKTRASSIRTVIESMSDPK